MQASVQRRYIGGNDMTPALSLAGALTAFLVVAVPVVQFTVDTIFRLAGI
jgi:hypothetical protein